MDVEHLNVVLGAKLGGLRTGLSQADTLLDRTRRNVTGFNKEWQRQQVMSPLVAKALGVSSLQMQGLGTASGRTGTQLDRVGRGMLASSGAAGALGKSIAFASTAFIGGAGLAAALKFVIGSAASVETELNVLQAVTRATGARMVAAGALAKQLGADIKIPGASAADAAQAMTQLAKGGLTLKEAMAATRGTLQLAAAAQLENAEAANITVGALNAFRLAGGQAVKVADLLAAAANAAQGSISDMALGLQQASAQAHASGLSVHETVTALTILAKAGIRGSDAGTSLRVMLQHLIPQSKKAAGLMRDLGIEVFDASGKMLPLRTIISRYADVLGDLNPKQRQFALQTIFGADASRAANIILAGGVKTYDASAKAVGRAGEAARTAGARAKGLAGAVEGARNSLETLAITTGQKLLPVVTPLVKRFGEWVGRLSESESFQRKLTSALDTSITALTRVFGLIGQLIGVANGLAKAVGGWKEVLFAAAGVWVAFKVRAVVAMVAVQVAAAGAAARAAQSHTLAAAQIAASHTAAASRIVAAYAGAGTAVAASSARMTAGSSTAGIASAAAATRAIGPAATASAVASTAAFSTIGTAALGLSRVIKTALITTGFGAVAVGVGILAEVLLRKFGVLDRVFGTTGASADLAADALARLRATLDGLKQATEDVKDGKLALARADLALERAVKSQAAALRESGRGSLAYREAVQAVADAEREVERAEEALITARRQQGAETRKRVKDEAALDLVFRQTAETMRNKLVPANTELGQMLAKTGRKISAEAFNREVIEQYRQKMLALAATARQHNIPSMAVLAEKAAAVAVATQKIPRKIELNLTAVMNKAPLTAPGMKKFGTEVGSSLGEGMGRSWYSAMELWAQKVAIIISNAASAIAASAQIEESRSVGAVQSQGGRGAVQPTVGAADTHAGSLLPAFKGSVPRSATGAVDYPRPIGTRLLAPEDGRLTRTSGRPGSGTPGGAGGLSLYFVGKSHTAYFMTHLEWVNKPGSYKAGAVIGRVGPHVSGAHAHVEQSRHPGAIAIAEGGASRSGGGGGGGATTGGGAAGATVDAAIAKMLGDGKKKTKTLGGGLANRVQAEIEKINDLARNKILGRDTIAALQKRADQLNAQIKRAGGKDALPGIKADLKRLHDTIVQAGKLEAEGKRLDDLVKNKLISPEAASFLREQFRKVEAVIRKGGKGAADAVKAYHEAITNAAKAAELARASRAKLAEALVEFDRGVEERLPKPKAAGTVEGLQAAITEVERLQKLLDSGTLKKGAIIRIKVKLEAAQRTVQVQMEGLLNVVDASRSKFERAFAKVARRAMQAFDAETKRGLKGIEASFAGLTPAEGALGELERAHDAEARARDLTEALEDLRKAQEGGDPEEIRRAQQRIRDIQYESQRAALQAQAEQERKSRDEAREAALEAYQQQRDDERAALEERLQDIHDRLLDGNKDALEELKGLAPLAEGAGATLGASFAEAFLAELDLAKKAWIEWAVAINKLLRWVNAQRKRLGFEELPLLPIPKEAREEHERHREFPPGEQFAKGGEFFTKGPLRMLVGEAGTEHVKVTPLSKFRREQKRVERVARVVRELTTVDRSSRTRRKVEVPAGRPQTAAGARQMAAVTSPAAPAGPTPTRQPARQRGLGRVVRAAMGRAVLRLPLVAHDEARRVSASPGRVPGPARAAAETLERGPVREKAVRTAQATTATTMPAAQPRAKEKGYAQGGEFIVRKLTRIVVGEGVEAEHVKVTPLSVRRREQQKVRRVARAVARQLRPQRDTVARAPVTAPIAARAVRTLLRVPALGGPLPARPGVARGAPERAGTGRSRAGTELVPRPARERTVAPPRPATRPIQIVQRAAQALAPLRTVGRATATLVRVQMPAAALAVTPRARPAVMPALVRVLRQVVRQPVATPRPARLVAGPRPVAPAPARAGRPQRVQATAPVVVRGLRQVVRQQTSVLRQTIRQQAPARRPAIAAAVPRVDVLPARGRGLSGVVARAGRVRPQPADRPTPSSREPVRARAQRVAELGLAGLRGRPAAPAVPGMPGRPGQPGRPGRSARLGLAPTGVARLIARLAPARMTAPSRAIASLPLTRAARTGAGAAPAPRAPVVARVESSRAVVRVLVRTLAPVTRLVQRALGRPAAVARAAGVRRRVPDRPDRTGGVRQAVRAGGRVERQALRRATSRAVPPGDRGPGRRPPGARSVAALGVGAAQPSTAGIGQVKSAKAAELAQATSLEDIAATLQEALQSIAASAEGRAVQEVVHLHIDKLLGTDRAAARQLAQLVDGELEQIRRTRINRGV